MNNKTEEVAALNEKIRVFADKMIREFIYKFREFIVGAITQACSDLQLKDELEKTIARTNRGSNPEKWDLFALIEIFRNQTVQERVFVHYFKPEHASQIRAFLMQIKDLRNKLSHEISLTKPISARLVYSIADIMQ